MLIILLKKKCFREYKKVYIKEKKKRWCQGSDNERNPVAADCTTVRAAGEWCKTLGFDPSSLD